MNLLITGAASGIGKAAAEFILSEKNEEKQAAKIVKLINSINN